MQVFLGKLDLPVLDRFNSNKLITEREEENVLGNNCSNALHQQEQNMPLL